MKEPRAHLAAVQKAPRHEVAGSWAPARQRALWRFNAGAGVDDGRDARTTPAADLHIREVGRVQEAFLAGVRSASTCDPCTDRCDWAERDRSRRGDSALEWESRSAHKRSGS